MTTNTQYVWIKFHNVETLRTDNEPDKHKVRQNIYLPTIVMYIRVLSQRINRPILRVSARLRLMNCGLIRNGAGRRVEPPWRRGALTVGHGACAAVTVVRSLAGVDEKPREAGRAKRRPRQPRVDCGAADGAAAAARPPSCVSRRLSACAAALHSGFEKLAHLRFSYFKCWLKNGQGFYE